MKLVICGLVAAAVSASQYSESELYTKDNWCCLEQKTKNLADDYKDGAFCAIGWTFYNAGYAISKVFNNDEQKQATIESFEQKLIESGCIEDKSLPQGGTFVPVPVPEGGGDMPDEGGDTPVEPVQPTDPVQPELYPVL